MVTYVCQKDIVQNSDKKRFMNLSGNLRENFQYDNIDICLLFSIGTTKINVNQINAAYIEQFTMSRAVRWLRYKIVKK